MKIDRETYLKTLAADEKRRHAKERYISAIVRKLSKNEILSVYAEYKVKEEAYYECLKGYHPPMPEEPRDDMQNVVFYRILTTGLHDGPYILKTSSRLDTDDIAAYIRTRVLSPDCDGVFISTIDDKIVNFVEISIMPPAIRPPALIEECTPYEVS